MTRFFNNVKTAFLLGLLFSIVLLIGSAFGLRGLIFAFLLGGLMNMVAFFYSDKIALATMRAQEVDERSHSDLVTMVQRLAKNASLPTPRIYVCPHQAPNAFATGRSPRKAAVAVTQGALQLLTYEELEGVMAHELSHVKNRDTLISCVAATIAGAISYLGWMLMWFGDRDNLLASLALAILTPIAAALIQMGISRSREYVADANATQIAGTPWGLSSALQKLETVSRRVPLHRGQLDSHNHMFIVQPLTGKSFAKLFSTHPATEDRIAKLRALA